MKLDPRRRRRIILGLGFTTLFVGVFILAYSLLQPWLPRNWQTSRRFEVWPTRWQRPYGMAPAAFDAFVAACQDSKISPGRLGQTIGDHPRSVGYHKKDGVLLVGGERVDYCAAVDIGVNDLDRAGINRFLHNLARHGFACWYREGGHWKGGEHVHAIYTQLPMKVQLRGQVKLFLRERRAKRIKPLAWERRLQRSRFAALYPKRKR